MENCANSLKAKLLTTLIHNTQLKRYVLPKIFYSEMAYLANPVEVSIKNKLREQLDASHLDVINESHMHNVPKGAETHFKVVVVSEKFQNLPLIKRHRLVYDILKDELNSGVHALSIEAQTPAQWNESDKQIESSPQCKGGFGK